MTIHRLKPDPPMWVAAVCVFSVVAAFWFLLNGNYGLMFLFDLIAFVSFVRCSGCTWDDNDPTE